MSTESDRKLRMIIAMSHHHAAAAHHPGSIVIALLIVAAALIILGHLAKRAASHGNPGTDETEAEG